MTCNPRKSKKIQENPRMRGKLDNQHFNIIIFELTQFNLITVLESIITNLKTLKRRKGKMEICIVERTSANRQTSKAIRRYSLHWTILFHSHRENLHVSVNSGRMVKLSAPTEKDMRLRLLVRTNCFREMNARWPIEMEVSPSPTD